VPFDVFPNSVSNFTVLIGFKKNAALSGNYELFFAQNNAANDERCYLGFTPLNKFEIQMSNLGGANNMSAISLNSYNDQLPHALVGVFDQLSQTVRLVIHTGEDLNGGNAGYVAKNLLGNSQGDFRIGEWNFAPPYSAQPGCYGDVMIFSTALSNSMINSLLAYECARLGIAHVPI